MKCTDRLQSIFSLKPRGSIQRLEPIRRHPEIYRKSKRMDVVTVYIFFLKCRLSIKVKKKKKINRTMSMNDDSNKFVKKKQKQKTSRIAKLNQLRLSCIVSPSRLHKHTTEMRNF